jgi:hypothetical protein
MNIALPILLLVFGGLTLWVLSESHLKWYLKAACISTFCVFTIIFWSSIHSFLGWPALERDVPEKVIIHWVVIKEPNKLTKFDGRIFFLLESVAQEDPSYISRFFGYRRSSMEPRLYGLKYSRELHEQIEKQIKPSLRKGKPVAGKLIKSAKKGESEGKTSPNGKGKKGGGSESQEQEWHFHELLPSEIHRKPEK